MFAPRKYALILLAASVVLPLLYGALIAFLAYWHYYRRGLPFEGMGAIQGILIVLWVGASLCGVSFGSYIFGLYKERRFSAARVLEVSLFAVVITFFASALQRILSIAQ